MTSPQGGRGKPHARASAAGFLLVDPSLKPVYLNAEALEILAYPNGAKNTKPLEKFLVEKLRSIFPEQEVAAKSAHVKEVKSGNRRYFCRVFSLSSLSPKQGQPALAILIERSRPPLDVVHIAGEFQLTGREWQAVELLTHGLTSKEIANRMGISPNTVKAFLRLIMIKTGVSTRSGIVGKILQNGS